MRRTSAALLLSVLVALAGCSSYLDFKRPMLRNYAADAAYPTSRPVPPRRLVLRTPEMLAEALARWQQAAGEPREEYLVGPGDVLSVSLFVPTQSAVGSSLEVSVSENGDVSFPLIGTVDVAGLTTGEIGEMLAGLYGDGYYRDPVVTAVVTGYASKRILVTGAVANPRIVVLKTNRIPLLEALLQAGGLTENAGDTVRLTRIEPPGPGGWAAAEELQFEPEGIGPADAAQEEPAEEMEVAPTEPERAEAAPGDAETGDVEPPEPPPQAAEVDLDMLLTDADTQQNVWVHPGDVVYVEPIPEIRDEFFYVLGYVRGPGAYPMPPDRPVRLMDALAQARGLDLAARPDKVFLLRTTPSGEEVHRVDLTKVAAAQDPDMILQPGDTIIVGTSWGRRTVDGILHALGLRGLMPYSPY